jgi:hypothetical protein
MTRYLTTALAYVGFILIASSLSVYSLGFKIEIILGIVTFSPKIIDWVDELVFQKNKAIEKLELKYKEKDEAQDKLLQRTSNIANKTELTVKELSKYQKLYNKVQDNSSKIIEIEQRLSVAEKAFIDIKKYLTDSLSREWR